MTDSALDQCLDLELSERSSVEVACAYRSICCTLLLRTVMCARSKTPPRKVELDQKATAIRWVDGGRGVITFEAACAALSMDPERVRRVIQGYVESGKGNAMNKGRPHSRHLARNRHATSLHSSQLPAAVPPADGLAPRHPDAERHRRQQARS